MNTVKNIFKITSISTALFLLLLFFTPRLSSPVITQGLTPKPANNSQPKPQQAQTNQTNTPTQNLNAIGRSSEFTQIIKFQDKASKLTFLKDNSLKESDLTPLNKLDAYSIHTKSLLATSGVQTFTSQHYTAFLTPTDPIQASQWHLNNTDTKTAWNHQIGSPNITVAVLDTGFGLGVSDLSSTWKINTGEYGPTSVEGPAPNCTSQSLDINKRCNNIDDDNDGYTDNYMGWNFVNDNNNVAAGQFTPNSSAAYHGTAVSSLIAGRANNGIGGSGMSWGSKVLPIQVLDDNGDGDTISVALGIRYAVDQGVDIINMSLGTNSDDPLVSEQIDYATQNGVIVIAASGNDGCDCVSYPARYPSVIAVGATNISNGLAGFSSYGNNLDIVAPGVNLCSVIWTNSTTTGLNTCGLNGTSFSAPLVAGAVALLLSQNPTLTPAQVNNALASTATKLTPMGGANFTKYYGYGLLNTLSALNDVSATSLYGSPISASLISLSQLDKVLDGYEYDKFNSTCSSTAIDVVCTIRAINLQTNQMKIIATGVTPNGTRSLQQDILTTNLTTGTWIIQSYLTTSLGVQSMVREKHVIITN
jgi:hypothetical protein